MDLDSPQASDLGRVDSRRRRHSAAASLRTTDHPRRLKVNALALFLHYQRLNFLVEWQDKTNIAATLFGILLGGFLQFLMVVILINRFGDAKGWDLGQIAFIFGLWASPVCVGPGVLWFDSACQSPGATRDVRPLAHAAPQPARTVRRTLLRRCDGRPIHGGHWPDSLWPTSLTAALELVAASLAPDLNDLRHRHFF